MAKNKQCTSCKKLKPLSEFSPDRRRPDGSIYFKPVCKTCNNKKTIERKGWKDYDKITKEPVENNNILSNEEVAELQEILQVKGELLSLLHTKIHQGTQKELTGVTMSKTFKIYQSVLDKFNEYISSHQGEKIQDLVSLALIEYMDKH